MPCPTGPARQAGPTGCYPHLTTPKRRPNFSCNQENRRKPHRLRGCCMHKKSDRCREMVRSFVHWAVNFSRNSLDNCTSGIEDWRRLPRARLLSRRFFAAKKPVRGAEFCWGRNILLESAAWACILNASHLSFAAQRLVQRQLVRIAISWRARGVSGPAVYLILRSFHKGVGPCFVA